MASDAKRAKMGASRYRAKFNNGWTVECLIKSVPNDIYKFYCVPYHKALSSNHQGKKNVTVHCASPSHKDCVKSSKNQATLGMFCTRNRAQTSPEKKVVNAEVKIINFLVQQNLPLTMADHLTSLFKEVFPDKTLPRIMLCVKQNRLPSSVRILLHIVVNILFNIIKPILSQ